MKKYYFLLLIVFSTGTSCFANITLPKIFSHNMVLQRNTAIPVWGWADANEKVEIRFNKQVKTTRADKKGRWTLHLDAETAGGPFELMIKGKNTVLLNNVLVGEVWLCSGQSNMEWPVAFSMNARQEIANAQYPFIRHIKINKEIATTPQKNIGSGTWNVCDSTTVGDFTAIGYFFAKNVYDSLKVPVGIINSSWGGTNIETWISREGFEQSNEFREMIAGMPSINLDSLSRLKVRGLLNRIENLQGTSLKNIDANLFKDAGFHDGGWPVLQAPKNWEDQAIGVLDGVVWFRKTIQLPSLDFSKEATLELAMIDDIDTTYINGIMVGNTHQWDKNRKYILPGGLLKEGKNLIAVKVVDGGGGGGFHGNAADMRLVIDGTVIPLQGDWKFQVESIKDAVSENAFPSLCFNAMIHPLIPFAVKGVLWYQGESNAGRAFQYRKAFPLLINNWRQQLNNPDMPFYFVQLATFHTEGNSNEGCSWAELREAQTLTLQLPKTGMCVTTDIGDAINIHPVNKQEVGKRLAALALNNDYNRKMICSGPAFASFEPAGHQAVISFSTTGSGLITTDKYGYVKGFEIAGEDQVFYYAKASIKGNKVVVDCDKVEKPVAVRFGWIGDAGDCNLFNKEGFPAVPFRTDEWKTVTNGVKYTFEKLELR